MVLLSSSLKAELLQIKDLTFVLSQMQYDDSQNHLVVADNDNSSREWHTLFLLNGKSAPAIPPLELRQGERVRIAHDQYRTSSNTNSYERASLGSNRDKTAVTCWNRTYTEIRLP